MHELSIAYHLVEIAENAARSAGAVQVSAVHLRLGVFSGVVRHALEFSFDIATADTLLQGCTLNIEEIPLVVFCPTCEQERELPGVQLFCCPVCGTPTMDIRQGKELEIVSIEVNDETETA
jgi:hydrogenase nickel incorporation protein HypA/HybF